jgi:hypothetical protein
MQWSCNKTRYQLSNFKVCQNIISWHACLKLNKIMNHFIWKKIYAQYSRIVQIYTQCSNLMLLKCITFAYYFVHNKWKQVLVIFKLFGWLIKNLYYCGLDTSLSKSFFALKIPINHKKGLCISRHSNILPGADAMTFKLLFGF